MSDVAMAGLRGSSSVAFEQYAQQVYAWAYRLLGRHHDALDVVQDVFLRWDEQCAAGAPLQPRGWLRRVTFNRAIDERRRRVSAAKTVHEFGRTVALATAGNSPSDQAELRADIAAALEELTDAQREVFVAKVYDEMTFAEVAKDLDVAVSTVKTHYLRAVRVVRDRLRPRWSEGR